VERQAPGQEIPCILPSRQSLNSKLESSPKVILKLSPYNSFLIVFILKKRSRNEVKEWPKRMNIHHCVLALGVYIYIYI
jgi:hypothetical protein